MKITRKMSVIWLRTFFMRLIRASLIFFLLLSFQGRAQLFEEIKSSFKEDPTLYFNWGSQYSFISGDFANIRNIRAGLDYGNVSRFGIGYNWLSDKFPLRKNYFEGMSRDTRLNMHYVTLFGEYTFYRTEKWEASVPAQAGIGLAWNSYMNDTDKKIHLRKKFFVVYEPLMTIQYRFFRYFAAGCGIGYRLMIINRSSLRETFTSPVVVLKTKLYFGEIWKDLTKDNSGK